MEQVRVQLRLYTVVKNGHGYEECFLGLDDKRGLQVSSDVVQTKARLTSHDSLMLKSKAHVIFCFSRCFVETQTVRNHFTQTVRPKTLRPCLF